MKSCFPLVVVLFHVMTLSAQSHVDRVVAELEFLSKGTINQWKYSTNFAEDPTKSGFDDSKWRTLSLDENIYPDSCWIRTEFSLPDRILGRPTSGPIRFLVSVDDFGYLWVNGESKGYFPWDGEFELTNQGRPGQKFLIAIKAINTGGPLRLIRAQMKSGKDDPLTNSVEDFTLGLQVAQKLLSFDTYQTNARRKQDPGIDKSHMDRAEKTRLNILLQTTAATVDVASLRNGMIDQFLASLASARMKLAPVAAYIRRFTLYFDSNAHIDAAWLWRTQETVMICRNTFASVMNMFRQRPDFTYTQSSAAYYVWMEKLYPELFSQIQHYVKQGRWEIVGGMWVEPDCNLPSGESWARHLLYAKRYFRNTFGTDVKIGWNPDSFGYNLNMPSFYVNAGIDAFITQKIGWNETNVFPHRLFWWESPDGSRILSYFPFDYVNTVNDPFRLVDWLRQFEANSGLTKMLILFGVGDHGGGPSLDMLDRIDRLKSLDLFPTIEYGTATKYIDWLRHSDLRALPVWTDELYLEYHQGTFTTQAAMKAFNRSNETLLTNAEKISSFASLTGSPYHGDAIAGAWERVLFNQFHDILPGSGIRENYIDATQTNVEAEQVGAHELNLALDHIARQVNTVGVTGGLPVIVFNTLSWDRTDLATVTLPEGDTTGYTVVDHNGKQLVSQVVQKSLFERQIIFIAKDVPSFGYATYFLGRKKPAASTGGLSATKVSLENNLFRVAIDSTTGWLKSIVDKRNAKELLAGNGNELLLLEDKPTAWDAWNIGLTGVKFPSTFRGADVVEQGPVRAMVRLHRDYLKPGTKKEYPTEDFPSSFFTQDIIMYNGLDRIDFVTGVDWWEEKTMLKVAFPVTVTDTMATYEIPYGTIRRSTLMRTTLETAQVEVPASRWADLSTDEYGISLLNAAKYGYDIKGHTMRLSLLRSPNWPDPTADRGKHTISYALYPHAGRWGSSATHQRGYEFNTPLLTRLTESRKGKLKSTGSFLSISPSAMVLTSIKRAEEGDAWILQWYEVAGKSDDAVLRLPAIPRKAVLSNIMEEDVRPVDVQGKMLVVPTGKHGIVTVKVYW